MSASVKVITTLKGAIGTRILARKLLDEGFQPVAVAQLIRVYAAMSLQSPVPVTVKVRG